MLRPCVWGFFFYFVDWSWCTLKDGLALTRAKQCTTHRRISYLCSDSNINVKMCFKSDPQLCFMCVCMLVWSEFEYIVLHHITQCFIQLVFPLAHYRNHQFLWMIVNNISLHIGEQKEQQNYEKHTSRLKPQLKSLNAEHFRASDTFWSNC